MQVLAVCAVLFRVIPAQSQGRFGDNGTVGTPLVRRLLLVLHHQEARTLLHYVAEELVLRDVEALEDASVELNERHGPFVAAQNTGGIVNDSSIARHFYCLGSTAEVGPTIW